MCAKWYLWSLHIENRNTELEVTEMDGLLAIKRREIDHIIQQFYKKTVQQQAAYTFITLKSASQVINGGNTWEIGK